MESKNRVTNHKATPTILLTRLLRSVATWSKQASMATGTTGSAALFRIQYESLSQRHQRARIRNDGMLRDARKLCDSLSLVDCNKLQMLKVS